MRDEYSALRTDLYQVTMAYGFWKSGLEQREGVFHMLFRTAPFKGGFTIACGLEDLIRYLQNFHFSASDLEYLATLNGSDGQRLFEPTFLEYLRCMEFSCDIDAVAEGTVVFPYEPLVRVKGPLIQCQLLESHLLNLINFQTLVATKAARMCLAAKGQPVLEFGLRRAQGSDGALAASRAAYVGGCTATSNLLAGKHYGIPVRGTMGHSWVMAFGSEREAFSTYARVLPNNMVLLVDTYSTLRGVRHAIEVGKELREQGFELAGIRLDSGDLAYLSTEARKLLNHHGFTETKIIASNDLDEFVIDSLKLQQAQIDVWGIGTKLVTAYDQPALDGVYKMSAVRDPGQPWQYKIKIAEQATKLTTPGVQQVRRYLQDGHYLADMIFDEQMPLEERLTIVDPFDITRQRSFTPDMEYEDLLRPVFRQGRCVQELCSLHEIRDKAQRELQLFHSGVLRTVNPHEYPVGLEQKLFDLRTELALAVRHQSRTS
jgi:nicotinate phosphoribosyltransferase